tara:strand:+ start:23 stop:490 length:468 start_codon:yes stop_codon:yes gene_type:complete
MSKKTKQHKYIILAAGCFWSIQLEFSKLPGILNTQVGYTDGNLAFPNYTQVCSGQTNHTEAVKIIYNPSIISLKKILEVFFNIHNPSLSNLKKQYQSIIFYHNLYQKDLAKRIMTQINKKRDYLIMTQIKMESIFYLAEEYHQNYLLKNKVKKCI